MNSLFDNDTVSTNDNAFVNLDVGKHSYKIASATLSDKGQGVSVCFIKLDTRKRHNHLFRVLAGGDGGRIAKQDMKALWDAMKLAGAPGLDRLPNFVDKVVNIEAVHTEPNEKGEVFANIRRIDPYDGPAATTPPASDPDDNVPFDAPTTTAGAAPVEPSTTVAPTKKWGGRKAS